jgi:hypothetical protein
MTSEEATATVFWTAFQSMSDEERDKFLARLIADENMREDLADILVAYSRESEPDRPFTD